jgi:hypothetical protein
MEKNVMLLLIGILFILNCVWLLLLGMDTVTILKLKAEGNSCFGFAQVKTMQGGIIYVANPNLLTCKVFLNDESAWKQCIGAGKK